MKKQVVMKVCSVAVDGMPKESHEMVLVFYGYGEMVVPYSQKHESFNCRDSHSYTQEDLELHRSAFKDVTHYAIIPSLKEIAKEG